MGLLNSIDKLEIVLDALESAAYDENSTERHNDIKKLHFTAQTLYTKLTKEVTKRKPTNGR